MNNYVVYICVFIGSVFIASVSQILLKLSANKTYDSKIKEYLNPQVIIAYALFFLSSLVTVLAYKYVPLSLGPVLEASGYIFIGVLGIAILKEKMQKQKLIGMIIIIAGIILFNI